MQDELRYRLLKQLEANPDINQRELAQLLGISLGKLNYCLRALMEKGLVKAGNFRRSTQKHRYAYLLTPRGIEEKARVTARFMHTKLAEYEKLEHELEELRAEVKAQQEKQKLKSI